jgi:hypothetical protein
VAKAEVRRLAAEYGVPIGAPRAQPRRNLPMPNVPTPVPRRAAR